MNHKVLIVILVLYSVDCSVLKNKVENTKWQCESICYNGKAEFDKKKQICRCILDEDIDEPELGILYKNAKYLGLNLDISISKDAQCARPKREDTDDETTTSPELTTTLKTTTGDDEIVGQVHLNSRSPFRRRIIGQSRQRLPPLTAEQQRQIHQQMRIHLNRLGTATDQRTRQLEIDAIQNNLRQLSQGVITTPPLRSRISADRLRNIVEQSRRQHRLPILPNLRLGSIRTIEPNTDKVDVNTTIKKPGKHLEIITQDPRLVDTEETE